jgi:hypothetical protein
MTLIFILKNLYLYDIAICFEEEAVQKLIDILGFNYKIIPDTDFSSQVLMIEEDYIEEPEIFNAENLV